MCRMRTQIWVAIALLLIVTVPSVRVRGATQATCPAVLSVGAVFDCSINEIGEVDNYTVSAQQNDTWYFRLKRTAGSLQPRIRLLDPNDVQVCAQATYGDYVAMTCNITTNGVHTFTVADINSASGHTGTYLVYGQHINSPANSLSVSFGSQTNAALQYTIEDNVYRFNAIINDKLNVRVRRTIGAMQPSMYVYDSTGNQLCGGATYGDYVGLDCTVTKTDTYYIFITDVSNDATGSYTLHLQRRNKPEAAVALVYGVPNNGSLSVKSEMDAYTFTAGANDQTFLRVRTNSGNLQPALHVYDQSGDSVCSGATYGAFVAFDCPITQAGVYNVIMDETGVDGTGDYTLYLQRTRSPGNVVKLAFGRAVNGAIEALGAFDTYTFEARKNDKINVSLARTAGSMTFYVGVFDPNGERICYGSGYGPSLELKNCAITIDGTHSLFVFDLGDDAVGTYAMTFGCATSVCGQVLRVYVPLTRR
jgi:hypothetical protein